jgi:hypoxanthine phosphoribosyltransferase
MDANDMGSSLKEILISTERLQTRIIELAAQIDADYADRELLLVGVLKGAVMVMADLAGALPLPVQMGWMAVVGRVWDEVVRGRPHPQGP